MTISEYSTINIYKGGYVYEMHIYILQCDAAYYYGTFTIA